MKKILYLTLFLTPYLTHTQVIIHSDKYDLKPDKSAMLELYSEDKGFLIPEININSIYDISSFTPSIEEGTMIFNTMEDSSLGLYEGFYYWTGYNWQNIGSLIRDITVSDVFEKNALGYTPDGMGQSAPDTIEFGGIQATKIRCSLWLAENGGNNHTYCIYSLNNSANWEQAFLLAKELGGYLPTITSQREWDFITTYTLKDGNNTGTGNFYSENIWIGYNRRGFLNNDGSAESAVKFRYSWITGTIDKTYWPNNTIETQFENINFENSDAQGNSCGYSKAGITWDITNCKNAISNYLLIEFNK